MLRTEPRSLLQEHQVVLVGDSSFQPQGLIENDNKSPPPAIII